MGVLLQSPMRLQAGLIYVLVSGCSAATWGRNVEAAEDETAAKCNSQAACFASELYALSDYVIATCSVCLVRITPAFYR